MLVPLAIVLVGAWSYRWVDEDAFINFRIIHNLLAGHGPVFNVGERVEVDSDPLWMFTLAAVHAVTPWASIEWTSVVLGLVCTAGGFLAGGAAVARLGARHHEGTVLPVGLLVVSVVAGVWEFVTSGLEMSMVFLWLGCSFLLLVRVATRRRGQLPAAVVAGLGTLIRPELALGSVVFVVALVALVVAPGWGDGTGRLRRAAAVVAVAVALPAGLPGVPDGLLRHVGAFDGPGQGGGVVVVVAGRHLPVELRRPVHAVAASGPGGRRRRDPDGPVVGGG